MLKGKKEIVLHIHIYEGKLSLMQETYSGEAESTRRVNFTRRPGNRKKRYYTQHTLIEKVPWVWCVLLEGRWWRNITLRPGSGRGKETSVQNTALIIENKTVPIYDAYNSELIISTYCGPACGRVKKKQCYTQTSLKGNYPSCRRLTLVWQEASEFY